MSKKSYSAATKQKGDGVVDGAGDAPKTIVVARSQVWPSYASVLLSEANEDKRWSLKEVGESMREWQKGLEEDSRAGIAAVALQAKTTNQKT